MFKKLNNLFGTPNTALRTAIKSGALLIDVRTEHEFAVGHARTSINIPLDELSSKIDTLPKDQTIVLFCLSGGRSAQAVRFLQSKGFTQVINGMTWNSVSQILEESDK